MTFDELVTEVYSLTSRPDLVADTESAIRAATLKMHQTDFYSKDLVETGVTFEIAGYKQQLDYVDIAANFRAFKYLRKADDACDDAGDFITFITPDEVLDKYFRNRTNVAYVAGRVLQIRSNTEFDRGLLGFYVHPIVTKGGYCSWIAEQYPYAIVHDACRIIFKTIGYDEQSAQYNQLVGEAISLLKLSAITDVGY